MWDYMVYILSATAASSIQLFFLSFRKQTDLEAKGERLISLNSCKESEPKLYIHSNW